MENAENKTAGGCAPNPQSKRRELYDRWKARKKAGELKTYVLGLSREERKAYRQEYQRVYAINYAVEKGDAPTEEQKEERRASMREYMKEWLAATPESRKVIQQRYRTKRGAAEVRPHAVPRVAGRSAEERAARRAQYSREYSREWNRRKRAEKLAKGAPVVRKGRAKGTHYVDRSALFAEMVKSREQNALTDAAWDMLMLIVERASLRLRYVDRMDREDCLQQARIDVFNHWTSFDPAKSSNPFSYFTEVAKNGYAKAWNELHPQKYKGTLRMDGNPEAFYNI